jgi:branched-chain amino acid transport system ATP-binding protein
MLTIDSVRAGYQGGTVLHDVALTVATGTVHAVVGPNGAGKTTLLHTIAGLIHPTAGTITHHGTTITGWPAHRIARSGVRLVPQGRRVFAHLTVLEHLHLAHRTRRSTGPWKPKHILQTLPQLEARRTHLGAQLSGGEQQMLALARALLGNPRLLLLDEPTEGLAPTVADTIRAIVRDAAEQHGVTVLLAESDIVHAAPLTERITHLRDGHTTEPVPPTALASAHCHPSGAQP